jgi:hypothetical protein
MDLSREAVSEQFTRLRVGEQIRHENSRSLLTGSALRHHDIQLHAVALRGGRCERRDANQAREREKTSHD